MQQNLIVIGLLAGGLGLFLLAVTMITEGLKSATGLVLRNMLSNLNGRVPQLTVLLQA